MLVGGEGESSRCASLLFLSCIVFPFLFSLPFPSLLSSVSPCFQKSPSPRQSECALRVSDELMPTCNIFPIHSLRHDHFPLTFFYFFFLFLQLPSQRNPAHSPRLHFSFHFFCFLFSPHFVLVFIPFFLIS